MTDSRRRWWVLTIGMLAQLFTSAFQFGLPFLLPQLTAIAHGSVELGALLVATPSLGLMASLLAWGWIADRFGERVAMVGGLASGSLALGTLAALLATRTAVALGLVWSLLFVSSALLAAVNSASARLILTWFPHRERGIAMGIRQTSQPLGVAAAAVLFPAAALAAGIHLAFALVAAGCLCAAALILVTVPARGRRDAAPAAVRGGGPGRNPYASAGIWRTHGASALLTVCQFVFSVFGYSFLVTRIGCDPVSAGALLGGANLAGAGLRVLFGWLSDRLGSRLRPLRWIAWTLAALIALIALVTFIGVLAAQSQAAPPGSAAHRALLVLLLAATALSASNNGLSYTLVAEYAGPRWTGRVLGVQNTTQNLVAAAIPPLGTVALGALGFPAIFLVAALAAAAAALALPRAEGRRHAPDRAGSPPLTSSSSTAPSPSAPASR